MRETGQLPWLRFFRGTAGERLQAVQAGGPGDIPALLELATTPGEPLSHEAMGRIAAMGADALPSLLTQLAGISVAEEHIGFNAARLGLVLQLIGECAGSRADRSEGAAAVNGFKSALAKCRGNEAATALRERCDSLLALFSAAPAE